MAFFLELPQNLVFKDSVIKTNCEKELENCDKILNETVRLTERLMNENSNLLAKIRTLESKIEDYLLS
jgi:hypothetical protein